MSKRSKTCIGVVALIIFLIVVYRLCVYCNINNIRNIMGISEHSIVETYKTSDNPGVFVKVINEYTYNEQLYYVAKNILFWSAEFLQDSEAGISDIVDIVFHDWQDKTLVEIAFSTNKGNGYVSLYQLDEKKLIWMLTDYGAVDRNLDTATNSMFEEGRLFLKLRESDNGAFYPDIILEGVENIYGYKDPTDYSWDEWLYQRNIICHVFRWDENSKKYILVEENRELLQQVEGVYPIWN